MGSVLSKLGRHQRIRTVESRELFQKDHSGWCVENPVGEQEWGGGRLVSKHFWELRERDSWCRR